MAEACHRSKRVMYPRILFAPLCFDRSKCWRKLAECKNDYSLNSDMEVSALGTFRCYHREVTRVQFEFANTLSRKTYYFDISYAEVIVDVDELRS